MVYFAGPLQPYTARMRLEDSLKNLERLVNLIDEISLDQLNGDHEFILPPDRTLEIGEKFDFGDGFAEVIKIENDSQDLVPYIIRLYNPINIERLL